MFILFPTNDADISLKSPRMKLILKAHLYIQLIFAHTGSFVYLKSQYILPTGRKFKLMAKKLPHSSWREYFCVLRPCPNRETRGKERGKNEDIQLSLKNGSSKIILNLS
uniref:Uncharacterized protein n=1 Tax=Micrurus carvalhoi TaxID=3147026 RepID=A0A2H6N9Z4_9SAUR